MDPKDLLADALLHLSYRRWYIAADMAEEAARLRPEWEEVARILRSFADFEDKIRFGKSDEPVTTF